MDVFILRMIRYNIYAGINTLEYMYTGLYEDQKSAEIDAWAVASFIANGYNYPNKVDTSTLYYRVKLTEEDSLKDLILNYIDDGSSR